MCESKVVKRKNGEEELLMEDVVRIEVDGDKIRLFGIFGEFKEISGRIVLMDMRSHRVVVE
ncbi:CooT family nickel-binding protein [Archaeoglobus veneficus]|uniref:RNA-binding protein n=1 Tax=Archaeoglobus veneficus (strain DSM 11195 / SNP6) TaxID=693661 RepID=F2KN39_ARCVS|nr:CooT family nickel-binding protein [Archaeoglobus veneficus]AEA46140.1 RNA-binding protein [Archaeoglobus veneficus SNP6]